MNIYIETLGCPKNANDSQVAAGILSDAGHNIIDNPDSADMIMVNTCGFINDAKKESIMKILEFTGYDDKILMVSGCLSKRYSTELYDEMPEVDIFIGVNEYGMLPEIIENFKKGERKKVVNEYTQDLKTESRMLPENPYVATVKISEGCNNRCTYCIIPEIRGPYRSRPEEDIISEVERLAEKGVKELILIGQDVTMYGWDIYGEYTLHKLIKKISSIEKIKWIRLMYCYEEKITDELIDVISSEPKVCNYIDIPIQHCSDKVLKNMKRRSTGASIENTISRLRKKIPDIAVRTTLITGFPGETDEDFDIMYDFVQRTRFSRLGVFAYSQEEGTPAGEMENQIDDEIKEARKDAVMRMQMVISREYNESLIGKKMEVIIDEKDPEEGVYLGRTQYDAPEIDNQVIIESTKEHRPGDFITVEIYDAYDYDIVGREI